MSVSQFVLAAAFLAAGNYYENVRRFWNNKPAIIFSSFYLLHLAGLLYTPDPAAGLNDLRIKLPLLVLPFFICGMPAFSKKFFHALLGIFVAAVLMNSLVAFLNPKWILISPIRFSMMTCFSIFILLYLFGIQTVVLLKSVMVIAAIWLVVFLFNWQYETGVVTFLGSFFFSLSYSFFKVKNTHLKIFIACCAIILPVSIAAILYSAMKHFYGNTAVENIAPEEKTPGGEIYQHYPERKDIENGNYTWRYIAWQELENAWNRRSHLQMNGNDLNGQPMTYTLIRFLTSRGFRKDAEGVRRLSDDEIRAIENGIANVRYMDGMNLSDRIYETIWSIHNYRIGNNPQGSSVAQRFEFWKAGWKAFLEKPVGGHGTGSIKTALAKQYEIMQTPLDEKHRLKTHNQYLAAAVAFGGVGFVWLIFSLWLPFILLRGWCDYLYLVFILILAIAMLVEDTLETQAGVTLAAFFISLFLSQVKER